jgi:glycosyltransferase involved in cell wall biosynthesis
LSYGLPVLVSDIPQNREIGLKDFRFFKVGDVDSLAKKMKELIVEGISEQEKAEQKEILEKNYSWARLSG